MISFIAQSSRVGSCRQSSSVRVDDKLRKTAGVETMIARIASRDLNDGSSVDKLMDSSHGRRSANLPRPASNPGAGRRIAPVASTETSSAQAGARASDPARYHFPPSESVLRASPAAQALPRNRQDVFS